jgi:hypothetical protein
MTGAAKRKGDKAELEGESYPLGGSVLREDLGGLSHGIEHDHQTRSGIGPPCAYGCVKQQALVEPLERAARR